MKKFVTELRGNTVMTNDGQILGVLDNFVIDTDTGEIKHILIQPSDAIEVRLYKTDAQGRVILPFKNMRSARDVIVVSSTQ